MAAIKPSERLLNYPPMERQDLNQSQLGSFKFTPVDNIQSIDSIATNYLKQQLAESLRRAEASRHVTANSVTGDFANSIMTAAPQVGSTDTDFFNKHIKPDLAESRLRLGPAALRSAVEGAAKSPTKQGQSVIDGQEVTPAQTLQYANQFWHFQDPSHSAVEIPNMDPTAAAFVPTTTLNESLGLALVNEQQAHNVTRSALRKEVERSIQLEDQIKKHQQQISRLTVTVNNLGAIIKHNLNKDNDEAPSRDKAACSAKDMEEAALHDFYRSNPHLAKGVESTGLPAESRLRENVEDLACPANKPATASANSMKVDETQLYNFELLTSSHDDGSPISALRQTLRKQFSIAEDLRGSQTTPTTPAKSIADGNKLINITPETESGESLEEVKEDKDVQTGSCHGCNHTGDTGNLSVVAAPSKPLLPTAETPILQLPTSFVNKYGRRFPAKEQEVLKDQSNSSGKKMAFQKIDDLHFSNEAESDSDIGAGAGAAAVNGNHNNDNLRQILSCEGNSNQPHTPSHTKVATFDCAQNSRNYQSVPVQLPGNFDGHPKWLLNKENPIFDSEEEIWEAVKESGLPWYRNSPFPAHPVRYLPEDAVSDRNAYRTVMIDNIPVGTTMKDVLAKIHSGALESIQLLPPIGRVTSTMTARVVFCYEAAADEMKEDHQKEPLSIKGVQVRVWKPIDPTYPLSGDIDDAIWGEEEASRILLIGNVNDYLFGLLPGKLTRFDLHRQVVEYSWTWDGYVSIEFADIKSAFKAASELKKDADLYGADLRYDRDYTSTKEATIEPSEE
ncbi:hypothetical protein A1O1_01594 [Capronia coronata CBS 617.96]|uniref:RRM domain-containing protein n=1 Tax=Capronia coronata CBS 617.96 TaxID=1182541 RepID=W9YVD3_9EURO|nr:uncharacterized protein A1O1_01594 [Capronia coronata CBS 617.96]EXJ96468.1 hypothetical protein A1O1_01594 [Capronia coronata CBS 617.96]